MNRTGSFFTWIRQKLLAWCIHQEIKHCIFQQLAGNKDCGYPFSCYEELEQRALFGELDSQLHLKLLQKAERMGKNYGQAFRYIMYRDLNTRLEMYLRFVERRTPHRTPLPQPQLAT